ncbi:Aspartate--ammonia ligase [compost metagenome]
MLSYTINSLETEQQIQFVKDTFTSLLKEKLRLHPVFAPLFVQNTSGLNDDLNGIETSVSFQLKSTGAEYAIVHSLAKWKRKRLHELSIPLHEGIVTNMLAIRADETLSPLHSALVDQWDWEIHITKEDRQLTFLKETVKTLYAQVRATELVTCKQFGHAEPVLPPEIRFIHAEDLLKQYPGLSPKERELQITQQFGAVFLIGIGNVLSDGEPHDGRAPDYDDWTTPTSATHTGLNGDLLVWNPVLENSLELSSMGIRVDRVALLKQLEIRGASSRRNLPFHRSVIEETIPFSIGGGIGQSRLAMFLLRKSSIAEVQQCEY